MKQKNSGIYVCQGTADDQEFLKEAYIYVAGVLYVLLFPFIDITPLPSSDKGDELFPNGIAKIGIGKEVNILCPSKSKSYWFLKTPTQNGLLRNSTSNLLVIKNIDTSYTGTVYCFGVNYHYPKKYFHEKNFIILQRFMSSSEIRVYGKVT